MQYPDMPEHTARVESSRDENGLSTHHRTVLRLWIRGGGGLGGGGATLPKELDNHVGF